MWSVALPDLVKMLRDLADAYEKESKGEADSELRKEIAALKEQIAAKPKAEREEAFEEISDEELELIRAHRAGLAAPPPPAPAAEPPPPAAETRTRPGRKKGKAYGWTVDDAGSVVKTDIAHIYSGEDEPDEVELPPADAEAAAAA